MCYWLMWVLLFVTVLMLAEVRSDVSEEYLELEEPCGPHCTGIAYECIRGACYCTNGFYHNYFIAGCVKCPVKGEKCYGTCCVDSLQCWHGICQACEGADGKWTCRDGVDQFLLISSTQVIMGTALILGIVATLVLLFKLCATVNLRPLGNGSNLGGRLSIGSLQMYIDERLRDAPPRYSRTAPACPVIIQPPVAYHNDCFIHDSSIPPPPYTEVIKQENNQNVTVHI